MTVLANIASAATNGTPAVAYNPPALKQASVNVHFLNRDTSNTATIKLYIVSANNGAVGSASNASMTDLVVLGANGGQMDRSGILLGPFDSIQYDVGTNSNVSVVVEGVLGTA